MDLKSVAKTGAELWAAKKGAAMTGNLLKWGAIAGVGYLGYKLYKNKMEQPTETA